MAARARQQQPFFRPSHRPTPSSQWVDTTYTAIRNLRPWKSSNRRTFAPIAQTFWVPQLFFWMAPISGHLTGTLRNGKVLPSHFRNASGQRQGTDLFPAHRKPFHKIRFHLETASRRRGHADLTLRRDFHLWLNDVLSPVAL